MIAPMVTDVLFACVVGGILLALVVDAGALFEWLRRR